MVQQESINSMRSPKRSNSVLTDKQRLRLLVVLFLAVAVAITWLLAVSVERSMLSNIRRQGGSRATFYTQSLRNSLEKFRHLPYILARDDRVKNLLSFQVPPVRVNPHLEDFGRATGALIFVMDVGGTVLATSNWRTKESLMGHNFSFRPYFSAARNGEAGGYFAFGLRTRKPGYFLSYPVFENGELTGVVAVKVNLLPLQENWLEGGETVMVSDGHGVLILASRAGWRYRSLKPLVEGTRNRLQRTQFLDLPLENLGLMRKVGASDMILTIGSEEFLEISKQLPEYGWRLHFLVNYRVVRQAVGVSLVVSVSFFTILALLLLYFRERRQKVVSRRLAREAEKISSINVLLQQEVAEHKATAADLRRAQKDLVQAGKLAALGRMSAAVAHELNQPVTAIRMFAASVRKLLAREQYGKAEETLTLISGLVDRMASLTGQLKTFARKDGGRGAPVDLVALAHRVVSQMEPQLTDGEVVVEMSEAEGEIVVFGDELRIEQVLVNLLGNGIEAVRKMDKRVLTLTLDSGSTGVLLKVVDSGPGINEEALDYLFEPFFTTKRSGEGLGLGLSISYTIVEDMGGKIEAVNRPEGGAEFRVELPRYRGEGNG